MKNINQEIIEAMHLRLYRKKHENEFIKQIADVYCVRPQKNSQSALYDMLTTIFEYGIIIGKRYERSKRAKHYK